MRSRLAAAAGALLTVLAASAPAGASILTFDVGATNPTSLPAGYGDNIDSVTGPAGTAWKYGQGNGFTPDIKVETTSLTTPAWTPTIYSQSSGFGYHVPHALGAGPYYDKGVLWLLPDTGWTAGDTIQLNSFDLGVWEGNNGTAFVQILDGTPGSSTVMYTASATLNNNAVTFSFAPGQLVSTTGIGISLFSSSDLNTGGWGLFGISNVNFDQLTVVPEPGTLALAVLGGAAFRTLRRRRAG